ncbi:WD40-repeat-containing domain protein [Melampsora americana]|nr:WD40-repeat-containing domain protein [Melampsora americana]
MRNQMKHHLNSLDNNNHNTIPTLINNDTTTESTTTTGTTHIQNNSTDHHLQLHQNDSPDFLLKPNPFNLPINLSRNYRVSAFGVSDPQSSHLIHPGMVNGKPGGGDCAKLCPRHQRMANEGTNRQLQAEIETLPESDQEAINTAWGLFSSSNGQRRRLILTGLLTIACPSQLTFLTDSLKKVCRIDPFSRLPKEISLKILSYFDAFSLGKAAQVSKLWMKLADDDLLWRSMCEQHIEKKCQKCGWGLPSMEKRKRMDREISQREDKKLKWISNEDPNDHLDQTQRVCKSDETDPISMIGSTTQPTSLSNPNPISTSPCRTPTKPWKTERNWRKGIYHEKILTGHTDSITCLQLEEHFSSPSWPILMTGSWDRTIRVWNLESQEIVNVGIRCLQFDQVKLITGAMDGILKIWNWRTGECMRSIEAHEEGVVCLKFDDEILASGCADGTIGIWNFKTGGGFVLRGHREWVNSVELWTPGSSPTNPSNPTDPTNLTNTGTLLFSASDDGLIKVWNLDTREMVRVLEGHMGQVQSIKMIKIDDHEFEESEVSHKSVDHSLEPIFKGSGGSQPCLVSGSLDNCLKVWDLERGVCRRTMFGHIQGVWHVDADRLRVVSGSHDRSLKIWDRITGKCIHTLVGHRGSVMAVGLSDDKIISGGDDGEVRIWSFAPVENLPRLHHHHLLDHSHSHDHPRSDSHDHQASDSHDHDHDHEDEVRWEERDENEERDQRKGKGKGKEIELDEEDIENQRMIEFQEIEESKSKGKGKGKEQGKEQG